MNIDYTLWPNTDGNLGNIKVAIPDGVNVAWPDGDALVDNFVYKDGKLVGFVDTKALTVNDTKTTTIDYDYVNIELPFAENAMTINRGTRSKYLFIKFNGEEVEEGESFDFIIIDFNTTDQETINTVRTAKRVVDNKLYDADGGLIGTWDTSKIEVGCINDEKAMVVDGLFCDLDDNGDERGLILSEFNSDLSNLADGRWMFYGCFSLISFASDLSSLTDGLQMFSNCSSLTSFTSDLSSLTNGGVMFASCSKLETFSSDLSSLTYGGSMFYRCTNLTSFSSDLPSLTAGNIMFQSCKLDAESVMCIADTIKDITAEKQLYKSSTIPYVTVSEDGVYSAPRGFMSNGKYVYTYNNPKPYTNTISSSNVGKLTLGINVTNDSSTIQQQLEDFAQEAHFDSWEELKQTFVDKGWTVTFQYGGTSTSITLSEDEKFRGVPVYARLIEVTPEGEEYTEEEKDSAEYCTEDGTKYYNIDWGHDVTDYDQYQYFGSLLEACGYFGVIPKKYLEEA